MFVAKCSAKQFEEGKQKKKEEKKRKKENKRKENFSPEYLCRHKVMFSYIQNATQSVLNAIPPVYAFSIPLIPSFTFVSYPPVPEKPITGLPLDACSKQQQNVFSSSHVNVSEHEKPRRGFSIRLQILRNTQHCKAFLSKCPLARSLQHSFMYHLLLHLCV